jgi:hypothetical protein
VCSHSRRRRGIIPTDHPIQVILDPHVQTAIFLIGGAIIAALVLFVLILADMTPINTNKDTDNDQDHF